MSDAANATEAVPVAWVEGRVSERVECTPPSMACSMECIDPQPHGEGSVGVTSALLLHRSDTGTVYRSSPGVDYWPGERCPRG